MIEDILYELDIQSEEDFRYFEQFAALMEDSIEYTDSEHEKTQLKRFIDSFFARPAVFLRQ